MESDIRVSVPTPAALLKTKILLATNRTIATNLSILEELADEHDVAMTKLRNKLPASYRDYVDLADHFTENKFELLRNRILRTANDARRELEEVVENLRLEGKE